MQLVGTVAGAMYIDFTRYNDGNCTQPLVYVHAVGTFNDLGPVSEALQASRKFALNFSLAYVMPLSDVGVVAMGGLCPCNGTDPSSPDPWAVNVTKILATCDPNNCVRQLRHHLFLEYVSRRSHLHPTPRTPCAVVCHVLLGAHADGC